MVICMVNQSIVIEIISISVKLILIIVNLFRTNTQHKADMDIVSVNLYDSIDKIDFENKKGI